MKKLICVFLAGTAFSLSAQDPKLGQIDAGRWLASGGICFDSQNSTFESGSNSFESNDGFFKADIYGGYAFAENQVVGLGLGYTSAKSTNVLDEEFLFNEVRLTPYYRRYKWCSEEFALVGTAKLPIGLRNSSRMILDPSNPSEFIEDEDPTSTSVGFWITPSFMWMPDNNWSLEAGVGSLGFSNVTQTDDNDNKSTDFLLQAKLDLFNPWLAFAYYF